jgi:hypothetical protein
MQRRLFFLSLLAVTCALAVAPACESIPVNDALDPPTGVIQGTVLYQGPHPCSSNGHIVGNVILLFFDQNDPPPPVGLATTSVNFGVVTGDVLFANEPRWTGSTVYCPSDHGMTGTLSASAPFAVSPFTAGTYILEAFFDYTGDFLPTFKFRNLPEQGDVGGGYIDTTAAEMHAGEANYIPDFLPIVVGVPSEDAGADAGADAGSSLVIPPQGYVANNVSVTLGEVLPLARPYFYPDGAELPASMPTPTNANPDGDQNYVPAFQMPQDLQVDAPPASPSVQTISTFQSKFVTAKLLSGVPTAEAQVATDPTQPFHFQLSPSPDGLQIWNTGQIIPEGNLVPELYPLVVFTKLIDDPGHTLDPQSLTNQGSQTEPIVVVIGITLDQSDSILDMVLMPPPTQPGPTTASDHVSVLVRPTALCVNPALVGQSATLVTPFLTGPSADPNEKVPPGGKPLFDPAGVAAALAPQFGTVTIKQGCLPTGRYAINAVYPSGQAWTVPNESGSCAASEGPLETQTTPAACSGNLRDVLYSQGTRDVLEITPAQTPSNCVEFPVPPECSQNP